MGGLGTLLGKIAAAVAPAFFAWVTSLFREWQAKRAAEKAKDQADEDLKKEQETGRPVWRD